MYAILIAVVALFVGGCAPRYADFFPYYDNGTKKPSLTILPVVDETNDPIVKENPDLLTKSVRNRLKRKGKIYCPPQAQTDKILRTVSLQELCKRSDLSQFEHFRGTDYVCLMEITESDLWPYRRGAFKPIYLASIPEQDARVLSLAVRLKIVDISGKAPKVVRQEIVHSNHMVAKDAVKDQSTLEMIRSRVARDIAEKIEQTVCVKK